jgi:hypothetical protein
MYSAHGRFDAGEGHLKPAARDQALYSQTRPSSPRTAGFGKTTLLAEWLATAEARKQPPAWLALDQSDNDPAFFWPYVIAALQTMQRDLGQSTLALLQSLQPLPAETVLAKLLNEVGGLAQRIVLVLDDYHLITATPPPTRGALNAGTCRHQRLHQRLHRR